MKNICLILCFIAGFSVTALGQYKIVPKTGEGRFDRSVHTTFWPNYIFTHPSFFLSNGRAEVRPMRKWWRDPLQPVLPVSASVTPVDQYFNERAAHLSSNAIASISPNLNFPALTDRAIHLNPGPAMQRVNILQGADRCMLKKQILKQLDIPDKVDLPADRPIAFP